MATLAAEHGGGAVGSPEGRNSEKGLYYLLPSGANALLILSP